MGAGVLSEDIMLHFAHYIFILVAKVFFLFTLVSGGKSGQDLVIRVYPLNVLNINPIPPIIHLSHK